MGPTNTDVARVEVSAWDRTGTHVKEMGEIFYVKDEIRLLIRADLPLGTFAFLRMYPSNGTEAPFLKVFHIRRSRCAQRRGFRILTLIPVLPN